MQLCVILFKNAGYQDILITFPCLIIDAQKIMIQKIQMKKMPITTIIFSDQESRKNIYINYLIDRNKIEMEKRHQLKKEFSDKYLYIQQLIKQS